MRLPGMLHARVIRPPRPGSQLTGFDMPAIERLPGVVKVIRDGNYLAVVAKDEWQAVKAMRAGYEAATWAGGDVIPDQAVIHQLLPKLQSKRYPIKHEGTPAPSSGKTYRARVTKQYLMHGSIGPSCSIAWFKDGMLTVWTHTECSRCVQASPKWSACRQPPYAASTPKARDATDTMAPMTPRPMLL